MQAALQEVKNKNHEKETGQFPKNVSVHSKPND